MLYSTQKPIPCRELLEAFSPSRPSTGAERIVFRGVEPKDAYNITAPFEDEGEAVIAARVELRSEELAEVVFFVRRGDVWVPRENTRTFRLQDPFFTRIGGELVFGGVEVYTDDAGSITSWRTRFYKGPNIAGLTAFAAGPLNMKDIRLVELADGRVGVFTRPHGLPDARARIGYTEVASLEALNETVIDEAALFCDQFLRDEWGGANEVHRLKNGHLGVLGHISYKDSQGVHYHAMSFIFDPATRMKSAIRILADRRSFPEGPAKRVDLGDVVFSGGLVRTGDGTAWLYAGVSDAQACRVQVPDPFSEIEKR